MTKNASICLFTRHADVTFLYRSVFPWKVSLLCDPEWITCLHLATGALGHSIIKTADTQYFIELCASQALNTRTSFICEPGLCLDFNLRHMLMLNPGVPTA